MGNNHALKVQPEGSETRPVKIPIAPAPQDAAASFQQSGQPCRTEPDGSRHASAGSDHFVEAGARQAAPRQNLVDGADAEGDHPAEAGRRAGREARR